MGSGLGASSTIVVSLIKALTNFFTPPLMITKLQILQFFYRERTVPIKRRKARSIRGFFLGVLILLSSGKKTEALVNSLRIKRWVKNELEASLLLFLPECLGTQLRLSVINQRIY